MNEDRGELTNLFALVALLISTAVFKEELSNVKLGSSSFTLFTVFTFASAAFGLLLYFHLFVNARILLLKALYEKKKSIFLISSRFLYILILVVIPIFTIIIASSNWLNHISCVESSSENIFGSFPPSVEYKNTTICQSRLVTVVLPILVPLSVVLLAFWIGYRREKKYRELPKGLRANRSRAHELRIMQAISTDLNQNNKFQNEIYKLDEEYQRRYKQFKNKVRSKKD